MKQSTFFYEIQEFQHFDKFFKSVTVNISLDQIRLIGWVSVGLCGLIVLVNLSFMASITFHTFKLRLKRYCAKKAFLKLMEKRKRQLAEAKRQEELRVSFFMGLFSTDKRETTHPEKGRIPSVTNETMINSVSAINQEMNISKDFYQVK